ncbi:MAG: hypothetical protein AB8G16_18135 [Gammaproteobacteria bacterium]
MTTHISALAIAAGVTVCAGVGLLFATADEQDTTASQVTQGMTVTIDAETGELRAATAEEAARLAPITRSTNKEAKVVRRADGSESMRLDSSYTTYSTVTRDEDGNWVKQCGLNHDHAAHNVAPQTTQLEVR